MIIAEIGLNHMGSLETGLEYVDVLKDTDVDGITFQIREKEYYERKEKSMFNQSVKAVNDLVLACTNIDKSLSAHFRKIKL